MEKVGFIGLGGMGNPMAKNLLKAGYPLTVWNRTRSKMKETVDLGATPADSPKDVAERSHIVITMVTDSPDVEEVVLGPTGVLKSAKAGMILIDMSTISPQVARNIAATLRAQEVAMLDAPVSGGDIGAINFLADLHCVDLVGLANVEVARRRQSGTYTTQAIQQLCQDHDVQVAVLYEHWFRPFGGLPAEWTLVGRWTIRDNVVCYRPTVCFYAVEPLQTQPLIANLRDFAARLPKDVIQDGLYLE